MALQSKKMIVEGEEDKRVIPWLMEHNEVHWQSSQGKPVVQIKVADGDQNIDEYLISTELKESGLTALGIIVDASGFRGTLEEY